MSWLINANALQNPLADQSAHMCVTSPPYWGLRSYSGTTFWVGGDPECDHAVREDPHLESSTLQGGKMTVGHQQEGYKDYCRRCGAIRVDNQLGLEQIPDCGAWNRGLFEPTIAWDEDGEPYIDWIRRDEIQLCGKCYVCQTVAVFREIRRVLRDDGTVWIVIGDSYWGGKGQSAQAWSTEHQDRNTLQKAQHQITGLGETRPQDGKHDILKPKDLVGIPWRVALALQADGWYLRSDIIWAKKNCMPESVTDRPTTSHEHVFLLAKSPRYFYDAEAVREDSSDPIGSAKRYEAPFFVGDKHESGGYSASGQRHTAGMKVFDGGRNRRTVWTIATAPYSGSHFATYPPALVEPCIKAGTSERGVCPKCGKPWERVVEKEFIASSAGRNKISDASWNNGWEGVPRGINKVSTTGWRPTCTCDAGDPIPATVLDPFVGSGTTLLVARQLGRRGVGLDLSYSYLHDQARKRLSLDALEAWTNGIAANDNGYNDLPMFAEVTP